MPAQPGAGGCPEVGPPSNTALKTPISVETTIGSLRTRSDRPPALRHPGFALKDPAVVAAEHRTPPALRAHPGDAGFLRAYLRVRLSGYVRMSAGPYRWCRDISCSRLQIGGAGPVRVRLSAQPTVSSFSASLGAGGPPVALTESEANISLSHRLSSLLSAVFEGKATGGHPAAPGCAVFSTTRIDGRTVMRAAIVNHRTSVEDVHFAIRGVVEAVRGSSGG